MNYAVQTFFDITATGITGHYKPARVPFRDHAGNVILDADCWNRARNQQRNWETLLQILGLRAQPMDLVMPVYRNQAWEFEFRIEAEEVYRVGDNSLAGLMQDCEGVPMVTGLTEADGLGRTIVTQGDNQNIWFTLLNNTLEQ